MKKPVAWFLNKLGKTEIAEALKEQECVMPSFDFNYNASQFIKNVRAMEKAPCEVTHAHALDNANLLPPALPYVELQDLIDELFDKTNWATHQESIEKKWAQDWQIKTNIGRGNEPSFPEKNIFLRENLQRLINRVKNKEIHSVTVGTEELLERYMQNITVILKKLPVSDEKLKADTLMHLAFEGNYCDPGILKSVAECYRNLLGKKEELSLKDCVRLIHQRHREHYFHSQYVQKNLHRSLDEIFYSKLGMKMDILNEKNDMHAYSNAVCYFAPRLGLPAKFVEHDGALALTPPFLQDLASAWMGVEHQFWKETTVEELKGQINREVNYPSLPMALVAKWYDEFIDAHVEGTEEEKDKIKEDHPPYEMEEHGGVPIYRLKPEILHLILLDFGVIALSA